MTAETRSICPYCGVGCGVLIATAGAGADARITGVRGDPDHPANAGKLCSKGSTLHLTTGLAGRALYPELRESKDAPRRRVDWDAALQIAAKKFAATIRAHGPDSVAFYISGQLLTEDYYVFNKLAKGLVGTNNVDTNSRLCMSSAVAGYKATLGADAPPCAYEDIDQAGCIFIAGSNTAYAHPILFRRIEAARNRNPALKLIVVDPLRTATAAEADLFLQIRPGTDVALFNGLLHVMQAGGWLDASYIAAHTSGFDALARIAVDYPPARVAALCGIAEADLVLAARWFATAPATLSLYCQGLNQSMHGTEKNAALINLHLATAQIGRAGAGPFSLTGQPNAMGGREVGGMANLLSGHRDLADPEHRAEVARLWGIPSVPDQPGKTAVELFDALADGSVKCVWIACTNPAQSLPDQTLVQRALRNAEFVVVQECFRDTETVRHADLLLPATTWGEKDGTVTNSERRISRVRAALPAPGEARHDWRIAVDFAHALASELDSDVAPRLFPYQSPEAIFDEHRETTRGRDLDISGLSYALLDALGPQQWPFRSGATAGSTRLYQDGVYCTADGRARFIAAPYRPVAEPVSDAFPIALTTGRLRDQWHGMTRTGRAAQLFAHEPEPVVTMHPSDLLRRRCEDGSLVSVLSARGSVTLRAAASTDIQRGMAFLPMHWGGRFIKGFGANTLLPRAFDPVSRQPELKHAAVQVQAMPLAWRFVAMALASDPDAMLEALGGCFDAFGYASCGLAGRERSAVVFRAASEAEPAEAVVAQIETMFGIDADSLRYGDAARGVHRAMRIEDGRIVALSLRGDLSGIDWLAGWMESGSDIAAFGVRALAGGSLAPEGAAPRGRIVCSCHNVAEREIAQCFESGMALAEAQQALQCGTGCGSCLPQLRRLAAAANPHAVAAAPTQAIAA